MNTENRQGPILQVDLPETELELEEVVTLDFMLSFSTSESATTATASVTVSIRPAVQGINEWDLPQVYLRSWTTPEHGIGLSVSLVSVDPSSGDTVFQDFSSVPESAGLEVSWEYKGPLSEVDLSGPHVKLSGEANETLLLGREVADFSGLQHNFLFTVSAVGGAPNQQLQQEITVDVPGVPDLDHFRCDWLSNQPEVRMGFSFLLPALLFQPLAALIFFSHLFTLLLCWSFHDFSLWTECVAEGFDPDPVQGFRCRGCGPPDPVHSFLRFADPGCEFGISADDDLRSLCQSDELGHGFGLIPFAGAPSGGSC